MAQNTGITRTTTNITNAPKQAGIYENPNQPGSYYLFDGTNLLGKQVYMGADNKWYNSYDDAAYLRSGNAILNPQFKGTAQGVWNQKNDFYVNNNGMNRGTVRNLQHTNFDVTGLDNERWNFSEHSRFKNRRWARRQNRLARDNRANASFGFGGNNLFGGNSGNNSFNFGGINGSNGQNPFANGGSPNQQLMGVRPQYANQPSSGNLFTRVLAALDLYNNNPFGNYDSSYDFAGHGWTKGKNGNFSTTNSNTFFNWAGKYGITKDNANSIFGSNFMDNSGNIDWKNFLRLLGVSNADGVFGELSRQALHNYMTNNKNFRYRNMGRNADGSIKWSAERVKPQTTSVTFSRNGGLITNWKIRKNQVKSNTYG